MKKLAYTLLIVTMMLLTNHPASSLPPQHDHTVADCSQPVMLQLIPDENNGINYRIAGKTYPGYPLDDLRKLLSGCKTERPLYVLIDYRVPTGYIPGSVASKLQANNVRYFIQNPEQNHSIIEIKIVGYYSKLP
jgi:hypothetical protein